MKNAFFASAAVLASTACCCSHRSAGLGASPPRVV